MNLRRRLRSITNGLDWNKRVCGKTPGVEAYPYVALPNPFVFAVRVCVSDCTATATDNPAAIVENSTFMVFTYTSRSRACPAGLLRSSAFSPASLTHGPAQ